MPEMRAAQNKDRYFRGDEVGTKPELTAAAPLAPVTVPAPTVPAPNVPAPNTNVETAPAPSTGDAAHHTQKIWRH
jgi:hypothetical protein